MDILLKGIHAITWQQAVMIIIGSVLIYLAIAKDFEPALLLPMGFGAILVNIPFSGAIGEHGILDILFNNGIAYGEIFPLLIFIGIGAMIDFGPLLQNPFMLLFGAAAQFGIFFTIALASLFGYNLKDAASIGIIGAADGPTSIFVATRFASKYLGAITVAAYSYMALVPIIQPFAIKLVTTRKERQIRMKYKSSNVSKTTKILFPIIITVIAGLVAPDSVSLIGFLMFGNLLRECGVLDRLSQTAQNELVNIVTILLGISIASTMKAKNFVTWDTITVIALGLAAFVFDTIGGVLFAKFLNLFRREKINPMIGAAGISAFPMSSRVIQKMAQKEDNQNFILMFAVGANVAGQIASVIAGGLILALVPALL
ncbi:sodium ion-translocating decarboxylase subunit beta [Clostridium thermarum]|uniref:sodium ion-translocating decarboxylase subunit beta n=1 Tax=Clostridium thermarum TaxID=1716543 RepID=UPI00112043B9|nr:sodium ion-translocating decarboxylase subunit beta [Clostridium thermarum]